MKMNQNIKVPALSRKPLWQQVSDQQLLWSIYQQHNSNKVLCCIRRVTAAAAAASSILISFNGDQAHWLQT